MSDTAAVQQALLDWYDNHGRQDLPWQTAPTPYRVWVSEVMLQQTTVRTVIPYFQRFMDRFPNVEALSAASLDDVLQLWSGLGYYSRARNLHRAAQHITHQLGGHFPQDLTGLQALPGIGRSTAGAVASISLGIRAPILDGNVKRWLTRLHALPGWPGNTQVAKQLWALAERYTPHSRLAAWTQAVMDLGAVLCTRSRPMCAECPLRSHCQARLLGRPGDFPGKRPVRALPCKSTRMLLISDCHNRILLEKRTAQGLWGGLWSLPQVAPDEALAPAIRKRTGLVLVHSQTEAGFRHSFSHYHLDIEPVRAQVDGSGTLAGDLHWHQWTCAQQLGVPAPVKKLLDKLQPLPA
ncbi:MAG: A/G-specific adenine glycosylase [Kistimonas sp.]|nr:A/G-specific adenine glycosylase [Kistimonas sp.]